MSTVILFRDIGGVPVNVVISEEAEASMEIPQHPVENGAKISDHAWRIPTTLKMECVNGADPAAVFQSLFMVMKQAEPFSIVTGFGLLPNMLIEKLTPARDVEYGQCAKFECSLKEVIIVGTQTTGGSGNGGNGDARASGEVNRGNVQATNVGTAPAGSSSESFLSSLQAL